MAKFASSKDGTINYRIQVYTEDDEHGNEVPSVENMTSFPFRPESMKGDGI